MNFFPDLSTLTLVQFLFFAVATIGMAHIIVDSSIFEPVRDFIKDLAAGTYDPEKESRLRRIVRWLPIPWKTRIGNFLFHFMEKVIECYQCCGTWAGFFVAFWLIDWHPAVVFFGGCAGSFFAYFAAVLLTYFESQSVIMPKKEE